MMTRRIHRDLIDAIQAGRADDAYNLTRDLLLSMWFDARSGFYALV